MTNRDRERITVLKDFLNCGDIGKVNKSKLDFCDREFILDYELTGNLLKKANVNHTYRCFLTKADQCQLIESL